MLYSEEKIVDGNYSKSNVYLLVDSRAKSIQDYRSTLIYELGHIIDSKYKNSSTSEFKQLYIENKIGYYYD